MSLLSTQGSHFTPNGAGEQSQDTTQGNVWMSYLSTFFEGEPVPSILPTGSEVRNLQEEEVITDANAHDETVNEKQELTELKPVTCSYEPRSYDAGMDLINRTAKERYTNSQCNTLKDAKTQVLINECKVAAMPHYPQNNRLNVNNFDRTTGFPVTPHNYWNHVWSKTSEIPEHTQCSKQKEDKEPSNITVPGKDFMQDFNIHVNQESTELKSLHKEQNPIILFPINFKLLKKEKEDKFILVAPQGSPNPVLKHSNKQSNNGKLQSNLNVSKSPPVKKLVTETNVPKAEENDVISSDRESEDNSIMSDDNLKDLDVEEILDSMDPAVNIMENTFSCIPCTEPISQEKPKHRRKLKRPMNAFMIWARKYRTLVASEFPGSNNSEVSVRLGEIWNKLPMSQQRPYFVAAEKLKRDYEAERPKYNFDFISDVKKEDKKEKMLIRKKRKRHLTADINPCLAAAQFLIGVKKEAGTYKETNYVREQFFSCPSDTNLDLNLFNMLTSAMLRPLADSQGAGQIQNSKVVQLNNDSSLVVNEVSKNTTDSDLYCRQKKSEQETSTVQDRDYPSPECLPHEDGLLQDVMMNIDICEESIALERMSKDNAEFFDVTDLDRYLTNISPQDDSSCEAENQRKKGSKKKTGGREREKNRRRKKKSTPALELSKKG